MSSSQLNQLLSNSRSGSGLTSCILNCSNRGQCRQDSTRLYCTCDESYFKGDSCQYDIRPCSSSPCLNGASCSNIFDTNSSSFKCNCNSSFFGTNCQNIKDLCANLTCIKDQGYCQINYKDLNPTAWCFCLNGYLGDGCSQKSLALQVHNIVVSVATILAIVIVTLFCAFVLFMDYLKYFVIKDKSVRKRKKKKKKAVQRISYKN